MPATGGRAERPEPGQRRATDRASPAGSVQAPVSIQWRRRWNG